MTITRRTSALAIALSLLACRKDPSDARLLASASASPSASASASRSANIPPLDLRYVNAIVATVDGGVVLAGVAGPESKIGDAKISSGNEETRFIAAVRGGRATWTKTYGPAARGNSNRLARGPSGEIWAVMGFSGKLIVGDKTFTPKAGEDLGIDLPAAPDFLVARLTAEGSPSWMSVVSGEGGDFCHGLGIGPTGPMLVASIPLPAPPYTRAPGTEFLVSYRTTSGSNEPAIRTTPLPNVGLPTRFVVDRGGGSWVAGLGKPGAGTIVSRLDADARVTWKKTFDGFVFAMTETPKGTLLVVHGPQFEVGAPHAAIAAAHATELKADGSVLATRELTPAHHVAGVVFGPNGNALVIGTMLDGNKARARVEMRSPTLELREGIDLDTMDGKNSVITFAPDDGGAWVVTEEITSKGTRAAIHFVTSPT